MSNERKTRGRVRCSAWLGVSPRVIWWADLMWSLCLLPHVVAHRVPILFTHAADGSVFVFGRFAVALRNKLRLQCSNLALKFKVLSLKCLVVQVRLRGFLLWLGLSHWWVVTLIGDLETPND